jgi:hypothetical protein
MGRKPNETNQTIPREELSKYLREHHRLFTMAEMARDTGWGYQTVKTACENDGLKAVNLAERVKEYIECNMHLTLQQQCEKLDMKIDSLRYYYKQFGYDVRQAGKGTRLRQSPIARKKNVEDIRDNGGLSLELALGPIAKKYYNVGDPIDIINTARNRLIGGKFV